MVSEALLRVKENCPWCHILDNQISGANVQYQSHYEFNSVPYFYEQNNTLQHKKNCGN